MAHVEIPQDKPLSTDLMNMHVVFEDDDKKILGEVEDISSTLVKIRFLGDFSFLIATLESFELINSKYDNSKSNGKSNIQNPDIPALIGACLYLVERIMLLYVSYQVYSHLVNECGDVIDSKYLEPNKLAILANIIGIIANSISLQAFIEIYKRNVDRPIFGR